MATSSSSASTPPRPAWAVDRLHSENVNKWPHSEDDRHKNMVRVMAFETALPSAQALRNHGGWVRSEGRTIYARVDISTDAVWILYERVVADKGPQATRVELTSQRWLPIRDFITNFPRAQKPYRNAVWTSFSGACTSDRPGWPELDDDEEMFMSQVAADKLDPQAHINYAQTKERIDEDKIRQSWKSRFVTELDG